MKGESSLKSLFLVESTEHCIKGKDCMENVQLGEQINFFPIADFIKLHAWILCFLRTKPNYILSHDH